MGLGKSEDLTPEARANINRAADLLRVAAQAELDIVTDRRFHENRPSTLYGAKTTGVQGYAKKNDGEFDYTKPLVTRYQAKAEGHEVTGHGDTPEQAMRDFDLKWKNG